MIGKKKKLTKKELQEDKLVTSFYKTQEFVEENKQKLIIGIRCTGSSYFSNYLVRK